MNKRYTLVLDTETVSNNKGFSLYGNYVFDIGATFCVIEDNNITILDKINITTNKNTIPNDTESPFKTSGLRIGTPAMTTRGFTTEDFEEVGIIIIEALRNKDNEEVLDNLRKQVLRLTSSHPLYRKGV